MGLSNDRRLEFSSARAGAIEAYAMLEKWLSSLFAHLLKTSPSLGGIVYFRIINTRSRNRILEDLLKRRYKKACGLYWNSLLKLIGILDQRRNEIVHWHMNYTHEEGSHPDDGMHFSLVPATGWATNSDASISTDEFIQFIEKCIFTYTEVQEFLNYLHEIDGEKLDPSHDKFQRALIYPPQDIPH